jgi:hypothetical protein
MVQQQFHSCRLLPAEPHSTLTFLRMRKCRFCTRSTRVICLHSTAGTKVRPAAQLTQQESYGEHDTSNRKTPR